MGASNYEIASLAGELTQTVEQFKASNDRRFEKKADLAILNSEVGKLNSAISGIEAKLSDEILAIKRQAIFAGSDARETKSPQMRSFQAKFAEYLRHGDEAQFRDLCTLHRDLPETKALVTNSEADGGFIVIPQVEQTFIQTAKLVSPVRQISDVVQIGSYALRQPVNKHGATSGWVGEEDPRIATQTSQMAELEWIPAELYCNVSASQQMLDDSYIDVEQWLASETALEFAQLEGVAFISGDGIKKPKGFLSYPIVPDASYAWGSVGYIPTGTSGGFTPVSAGPPVVQGADVLNNVIAALKYPYRPNAVWVMNRKTVAVVRQLKDLLGQYLWQQNLQLGQPATLLGFPIVELEDMPDIGPGAYAIGFGDFRQFYRVVDRIGMRTIRDPFTARPYVVFYTTKRVAGGIRNFEAAKLLRFAAS